jgi:hypothetical protein
MPRLRLGLQQSLRRRGSGILSRDNGRRVLLLKWCRIDEVMRLMWQHQCVWGDCCRMRNLMECASQITMIARLFFVFLLGQIGLRVKFVLVLVVALVHLGRRRGRRMRRVSRRLAGLGGEQ